ncbi:MAG: PIN domain nuclease [Alphaproteobacteria bacterium]
MIVVDASVWIAHFRNEISPAVLALREIPASGDGLVGDITLLECLQGARDDRHAGEIEATLRTFSVTTMLSPELAIETAKNYRRLRALGLTPRKTIDLIIATFCIAGGHSLLHQDRDFEPMRVHLGLRTASVN